MLISDPLTISPMDPNEVRREVLELKDLPAKFPILQQAIEMSGDEICSTREIERVLEADQAIAAQLLRIANSAFYSLRGRITTVARALVIIGNERLRSLLLQMLMSCLFQRLSAGRDMANPIREASIAASAACRSAAGYFLEVDAHSAATAGLLHNIGELVLLSRFPEQFRAVADAAGESPRGALEEAVFGVTSGGVGHWLIDEWKLPPIYGECAESWPDALFYSADLGEPDRFHQQRFLDVAHVGIYLGRAWAEKLGVVEAEARMSPEVLHRLDLDGDTLLDIYGALAEELSQVPTGYLEPAGYY